MQLSFAGLFGWIKRNRIYLIAALMILTGFLLLPVAKFSDPTNTVLESKQGDLLAARITEDGQWRFPECDSVPEKMYQCIRYFEDEYFRFHPGVNPVALLKALYWNMKHRRIVSGGSTITMQVIRLSRKNKPRTVYQKTIETMLALRLELSCSKDKIFALYASHAPFGGNVVGLDAASWRYFGRPPYKLSWAESATLAVLPNAPALIYPGKNHELLLKKRNTLLDKLQLKGVIDRVSCELAKSEPLPAQPFALPQLTPHLLDRVESDGYKGQRIVTTIQKDLQEKLNHLVERYHRQLRQNEIYNAALLVVNIRDKSVAAYIGNTNDPGEDNGSFVDIIDAPRSSGSILKPILFEAMLDEGQILPDMLVPDVPTHISGYSPVNFDKSFSGAVPASTALVRSLNVPMVRLLKEYGLEKFHSILQKLGFSTITQNPGHYGLTLILGGAEITLWDLCRVYMGMANCLNHIEEYGYQYDPEEYEKLTYLETELDYSEQRKQSVVKRQNSGILSAGSIWQCFDVLTELKRPTQEGPWEQFSSSKTIAWKTGTSFGFRDAWAVGVNPDYLVGVWVGNADGEGRPGLTGINAAAPLMFDAFDMLPSTGWFDPPYDVLTEIEICAHSGYRAGPDCDQVENRLVPVSGMRMKPCPFHRIIHLDQDRRYRVQSDCYEVDKMINVPWFVLPPVMEWYYKRNDPHYRILPPFRPKCTTGLEQPMEMIYPRNTKQVFIPRDLDGTLSRVVFEVAHRNSTTTIYWHLDEEYLGETTHFHQMEINTQEGWHTLTLVDSEGNILQTTIEVVGK